MPREMLIINDDNYQSVIGNGKTVFAAGGTRLLSLTDSPIPRGQHPNATPFSKSTIDCGYGVGVPMPKSARIELSKYLDEIEGQIEDHIDFPPYDQDGLPYCWNNAGCQAATTKRVMQGLPYVQYSSASVGCLASNYRIRGGYGGETLEVLTKVGAVNVKYWGNNAVSRSLDTDQTRKDRENHLVLEFIECENDDEMYTCLVLGMPTSNDYSWWRHVVMGSRHVVLDGDEACGIRNSWGNWGTKNKYGVYGFGVLQGRKASPDYCFAVRQVTASEN